MNQETAKPAFNLGRIDALLALLAGGLALALYARTLATGMLPSDSGEFQVLGYLPAHAHNPGYWVYLLMVKAFTLLPLADIATRVSLFSALMGGVTVACTYLAGRMLSGSRWAGALGALALAVSATFWSQAIIAEVYTAGSAFAALVLVLLLAWEQTRKNSLLFWAALAGALGPGVHGTIVLMAPAAALLVLAGKPEWRRIWRPVLGGGALGLALLLGAFAVCDANQAPYNTMSSIYIPSRSNFGSTLEELQRPEGRFLFLISSRQWNTFMFQDPVRIMPGQAKQYYTSLPGEFSPLVLALAGVGFLALWPRRPRLGAFFLLAGLAHHFFVFNYPIGDIYAFYLPWFPYLCALAAAGLGWVLREVGRRLPRWQAGLSLALGLAAVIVTLAPIAGRGMMFIGDGEAAFEGRGFPSKTDRAGWYRLISATVRSLPENALVFADWYNLYAYYYAACVEQGRTDLAFVEPIPFSTRGLMAQSLIAYAKEQAQKRPVMALMELQDLREAGMAQRPVRVGPTQMFRYGAEP